MFGQLRDSISNLVREPFACGRRAVNEGDVEENVIEVGFGNWGPYRPGHRLADSFVGKSVSQSSQHLIVVERPGKPLLALLDGQPVSLIPASKPLLFALFERAERVAQTVRRRSGGKFRQAYSAKALGDVAAARGPETWQRATYFYEEAVRVARMIGARSVLATTLLAHARLLGQQGNAAAALAALDEAAPHFHALAMRWHIAQSERLRERLAAGEDASHPS